MSGVSESYVCVESPPVSVSVPLESTKGFHMLSVTGDPPQSPHGSGIISSLPMRKLSFKEVG